MFASSVLTYTTYRHIIFLTCMFNKLDAIFMGICVSLMSVPNNVTLSCKPTSAKSLFAIT